MVIMVVLNICWRMILKYCVQAATSLENVFVYILMFVSVANVECCVACVCFRGEVTKL